MPLKQCHNTVRKTRETENSMNKVLDGALPFRIKLLPTAYFVVDPMSPHLMFENTTCVSGR